MRILAFIMLAGLPCFAGDTKDYAHSDFSELKTKVFQWLEKNDDKVEWDRWNANLTRRLLDIMAQSDMISFQNAADRVLTEYLRGIDKQLDEDDPSKLKPENRVLLCRWLIYYASHELLFDPDVKKLLTVKNFELWIEGKEVKHEKIK